MKILTKKYYFNWFPESTFTNSDLSMSTRGYYLLGIVAEQRLEFKTAAEYFKKVTNWPSTTLAVRKSRKWILHISIK